MLLFEKECHIRTGFGTEFINNNDKAIKLAKPNPSIILLSSSVCDYTFAKPTVRRILYRSRSRS